MNAGQTARWTTRFIAIAMVVVALLAFKVMESQLERIGKAADRVDSRAGTKVERGAPDTLPQPATALLPTPGPKLGESGEGLDSTRVAPEEDPAEAARDEALPQAGVIPEGAIW